MCRPRYPKIRPGPGRHPGKAQGALEMVVAVIPIFVFLFCMLNVFLWLNERMVRRQKKYEQSRTSPSAVFIDESADPKLNVFKGWEKLKGEGEHAAPSAPKK